MATALLEILVKIRDEATQAVSRLSDDFKNADISLKGFSTTAGMAAGALAAIGGVTFGLAIKAAEDASIVWLRVATILKGTGVSYDDLRKRAEDMAQTSIFSAQDIGEAYAKNISLYGDTQTALDKTKLAMDIAATAGEGLQGTQIKISRATDENIRALRLLAEGFGVYIGDIDEHADKGEQFAILLGRIGEKVGENDKKILEMSGLKELHKQWNELLELIGGPVLEVLNKLLHTYIIPLIQKVKEWADKHPELFKNIVIVMGALTLLLVPVSGFLLALPGLIILFKGLGIIIGAIGAPILLVVALFAGWLAYMIIFRKQIWEGLLAVKDIFFGIFGSIRDFIVNTWNQIVDTIREKIDWIMDKINWVSNQLEAVKNKVGGVISGVSQKVSGAVSTVGGWLGFQGGGIVTRPTLAMIGEAGPEAVIPLNRGFGGNIIINLSGTFYTEEEQAEKLANQIAKLIKYQIRV